MNSLKPILLSIMLAPGLGGCLDSGVRDYPSDQPVGEATTLADARMAVLKRESNAARSFYEDLRSREAENTEAIYMTTALKWNNNLPKPAINGEPRPNQVLSYLSAGQVALRPLTRWIKRSIASDFDRYSSALAFAPISLGKHFDEETFFDVGSIWTTSMQAYGVGYGLQLAQAINLAAGPDLDTALIELREAVYATPECRGENLADRARLACAQRVMDQGLAKLHKHSAYASFLDVDPSKMEALNELLQKVQRTFTELKGSIATRPSLGENQGYLTFLPSAPEVESMSCFLEGVCNYEFETGKTIKIDVATFLRTLDEHRGLRALIPTKVKVVDRVSTRLPEFFRGLEFADPTLGGLFPDGDLLEKARANPRSELAMMAAGFVEIMTAWAFGDRDR